MAKRPPCGKPPSQRGNRLQRKKPEETGNRVDFIAIHEAGHAVAAVVVGMELVSVDIYRRTLPGGVISMGFCRSPVGISKDDCGKGGAAMKPAMIQGLAGPLAELRINPDVIEDEADMDDRNQVKMLAAMAVCKPELDERGRTTFSSEEQSRRKGEIDAIVSEAIGDASQLVADYWWSIVEVANLLLKKRSLTGAEVAAIVAANPVKADRPSLSEGLSVSPRGTRSWSNAVATT